jgi:hypothetical protein
VWEFVCVVVCVGVCGCVCGCVCVCVCLCLCLRSISVIEREYLKLALLMLRGSEEFFSTFELFHRLFFSLLLQCAECVVVWCGAGYVESQQTIPPKILGGVRDEWQKDRKIQAALDAEKRKFGTTLYKQLINRPSAYRAMQSNPLYDFSQELYHDFLSNRHIYRRRLRQITRSSLGRIRQELSTSVCVLFSALLHSALHALLTACFALCDTLCERRKKSFTWMMTATTLSSTSASTPSTPVRTCFPLLLFLYFCLTSLLCAPAMRCAVQTERLIRCQTLPTALIAICGTRRQTSSSNRRRRVCCCSSFCLALALFLDSCFSLMSCVFVCCDAEPGMELDKKDKTEELRLTAEQCYLLCTVLEHEDFLKISRTVSGSSAWNAIRKELIRKKDRASYVVLCCVVLCCVVLCCVVLCCVAMLMAVGCAQNQPSGSE